MASTPRLSALRSNPSPVKRVADAFEGHPLRWSMLFVLPFLALLFVKALRTPMWLDEFYTFWIAGQPSISASISAVREGCDNAPPLYAILVKFLQHVLGPTPLALRLPSFLGFCLMGACAFSFLRRRLGPLYAALGVLIVVSSTYPFATEGRSYGLTLGCVALALFSWQAAAEGRRRTVALSVLLLSLAFAISLQYYAVFVLVPLGLAELSRWFIRRKIDVPVFLALLLSPAVLLLHLSLIQAGRAFVGHFWQKGSLADIPLFYRNGLSDATLWAPFAVVLLAAYLLIPGTADSEENNTYSGLRAYEWVAVLVLALLPATGIPVSMLAIGIGRSEYFMPALLGLGMLISAALLRIARGRALAPLALVLALSVWLGTHGFYQALHANRLKYAGGLQKALAGLPAEPTSIFIANPLAFVELWYYGGPELHQRVFTVASPEIELREASHDTVARMWLAIIRHVAIPVLPYDSFVQSRRRFYLAADPGDHLPWLLLRSGYHVQPLKPDLFLVDAPTASAR